MNLPNSTRKIAASLACLALLIFVGSASAALTVTRTNQIGTANTYPFTPTWTPAPGSLIAGLAPSTSVGNFNLDLTTRNVNSLTSGGSLTIGTLPGDAGPDPIGNTTTSSNYVTCGNRTAAPAAGALIVYTLPASANGYNLTNITVYSGWADSGRDAQAYSVLYSTKANPDNFILLTNVSYNPTIAGSTPSANQVIISDTSGGVIAANVAAVEFVFSTPTVENGWTGYGAITVEGTAAASVVSPVVSITTSNQTGANPYTPTWTLESFSLIAGMAPTTAAGTFTSEASGGTNVLTDGVMGQSGNVSSFATCGNTRTLIYTLANVVNGSDVTNIVLYSGWGDRGRDGQYFTLSYSTVSAPTTFIPITTVFYNPEIAAGIASANRITIAMNNGTPLASAVGNLKFDFSPTSANQFDNGYQGYSEIIVQGNDTTAPPPPPSPVLTQDTLPSYAETVVGDQIIFMAAYSNSPPANLQWQLISGGVTNDISGATSPTLTLNDLQLTNSGTYRLKAVNATNSAAAPSFSTAASLVVSNVPAAVNNIILKYAGQSGLGPVGLVNTSPDFYPAWTINTNNDLILGFPTDGSGNPGTATTGAGNYGLGNTFGDPTILADGTFGYIHNPNSEGNPSLVSCGSDAAGPGASMTYWLNTVSATNGFDLTNITVYGGWVDGGRNEQKYEVKYSTIAAPTSFNSLGVFDYNPNNPNSQQSATRVTLLPATGALAQNVAGVQINWALQGSPPKNGWEGYSEIIVNGTASAPKPVLTQDINPLTAKDVAGSTLTLTAGFTGATSYQWQKNGTNISGATSPTLTLSPLQSTDTATNGGYRLMASNGAGTSVTRGCAVIVDPAPSAVGNIVRAAAYQTSDTGSFTPTWDTSAFAASLINGAFPDSFGTGNFNDPDPNPISQNLAGGLPVLTDSGYGAVVDGGPHPAFATCGPSAGQFVIYTLPASSYGYDLTNILISSGWNDAGRDTDWATVLYSTVANPTTFIPITVITNNPSVSTKSVIRSTIKPVAGVLASNVYAFKVDFTIPPGIENGYAGFSQINVYGSPSALPPSGPVVTVENQNTDVPTWILESGNLIAGQLPGSVGPGNFQSESAGGTVVLTDGSISPLTGALPFATCGNIANGAGQSVTYNSASGWNLTNIVVYSGWANFDRDGQFYNVSYSTLANPGTFIPLVSVDYNPLNLGGPSANRVAITNSTGGSLATGVGAVKFDFTRQGGNDNGYSGYAEIVLQGTVLAHLNQPYLSGANLILTGAGTPGDSYAVLTSTNVAAPIASWTTNVTGVINGSGILSNAIPFSVSEPERFFRLKTP